MVKKPMFHPMASARRAKNMRELMHAETSLREWLVENNVKQKEFSQRLSRRLKSMGHPPVTQQTVSRWLNVSTPTLEMIEVIEEETGGEVSYKSFHMRVKYEGDLRLVEAGKVSASILSHWRK